MIKAPPKKHKRKAFGIIHKTKCPAVLIEGAFMDNEHDAARLASARGVDAIAETLVVSAVDYGRRV
jgi:N-acetylmuramoyl-L-alanine amidase